MTRCILISLPDTCGAGSRGPAACHRCGPLGFASQCSHYQPPQSATHSGSIASYCRRRARRTANNCLARQTQNRHTAQRLTGSAETILHVSIALWAKLTGRSRPWLQVALTAFDRAWMLHADRCNSFDDLCWVNQLNLGKNGHACVQRVRDGSDCTPSVMRGANAKCLKGVCRRGCRAAASLAATRQQAIAWWHVHKALLPCLVGG